MATVEKNALDHLRLWHRRQDHPIWFRRFSEQEQKHQVEDDLSAGYGVGLLLMTIFALGVALMGTTVFLTVF